MSSQQNDLIGKQKLVHPAKVKVIVTLVIAAALVATAVVAGIVPRLHQRTALASETRELAVVTVAVVSPAPGQSAFKLPLPAEVKPLVEAPIYARASGYLKRRLVDIGTRVEANQLLAEIDAPEQRNELERARALQSQAEAALALSKLTAARWAGLMKIASVSEQENAEKQADVELKTAAAESARAEVRRLEQLASFTRITAPFAGTITARTIDSGDLIVAGAGKELFHLAQTAKLRIFVQVPQAMARGIQPGQTAELTLPDLPGRSFSAKVARTAGVIASDSRTLLVELELDNPKGEIMAGGYAQVRFADLKMKAALTLPANTLLFRPDGPQVAVVRPDSTVELRAVKLGRDFGQTVEILTGVAPEDRIIANPSDSISTGAAVAVAPPAKTEKSQ